MTRKLTILAVFSIAVTALQAQVTTGRQTGIVLEINRTARVDAALATGAEITDLPIVGRNVYTLLSPTPGVDSNANSIVLGYPEQRTPINGGVDGGAGSVNYFLDGFA